MDPPPAPWSYAARAAYFGEPLCPFCDYRNPAAAKFCSDCGSPLHLKRCNQCDAVNSRAATSCYECGAEYPASLEAMPLSPAASPTAAWPIPRDADLSATVTGPLLAATALRTGWRLAVVATIMTAGAYVAYRMNVATPDAVRVASQPVDAGEQDAPTAASAVPMAVESKLAESETTATLEAPIPNAHLAAPKRASARQPPAPVPAAKRTSVRQTPVPVPATKRASARQAPAPVPAARRASVRQRPVPELQARVGTTTTTLASASVGAPGAKTSKARRADPWQAMQVSLSRCGGDLIARIVCDQRVRRRFCEGHWGEAPQCGSGIAIDRGQ